MRRLILAISLSILTLFISFGLATLKIIDNPIVVWIVLQVLILLLLLVDSKNRK